MLAIRSIAHPIHAFRLGPCGSWARDRALSWFPEVPLQGIQLSFPCEYPLTTDPNVNPGRPRALLLLCKTVDLIVNITGTVLPVFLCIGALVQVLQLRGTLLNHKRNMLSLRRGDWSVVPKKMRRKGDLSTISSLMYFVVFVWIQSSFGVLFFMGISVIAALVITVPILAMVPWFDPDTTIYPEDFQKDLVDWILNGVIVGTFLAPLLKLMINVAIVFLFFTIGSRHPVVTRNRGLFMWYESVMSKTPPPRHTLAPFLCCSGCKALLRKLGHTVLIRMRGALFYTSPVQW